ncbi:apolipoprotein N-acyltransferase [Salinisphaera orenii]|uniref:apolipoprotein N-acyltransferase n=1 Tax=Salinisphaera orenii TaxID=856731 RepID=UPI000DBE6A49
MIRLRQTTSRAFRRVFAGPFLLGPVFAFLGLPTPALAAGSGTSRLPTGNGAAAVTICYEIAFSRQVASRVAGTGLLLNLSDDAWFGDSIGPAQNLQMAQMRAMETRRPVLRATNNGITAAIDRRGRLVSRAPRFETATLSVSVTPRTGLTPYVRWVDQPLWGLPGSAGPT